MILLILIGLCISLVLCPIIVHLTIRLSPFNADLYTDKPIKIDRPY